MILSAISQFWFSLTNIILQQINTSKLYAKWQLILVIEFFWEVIKVNTKGRGNHVLFYMSQEFKFGHPSIKFLVTHCLIFSMIIKSLTPYLKFTE